MWRERLWTMMDGRPAVGANGGQSRDTRRQAPLPDALIPGGGPSGRSPDHGSHDDLDHLLALPVVIRAARGDDLPALEWFGLHTPHRAIIAGAYRMQEQGTGAILLAETNGFPAGQICIDFLRKRHVGRATLWALRVFQPFRRLGLGTLLMQAAERMVAERGVNAVELGVDRDNATVLPFYDRLGYCPCGAERGHFSYRTPDDLLVRVPIDQWLLHKRLRPAGLSAAVPDPQRRRDATIRHPGGNARLAAE